MRKNAGRRSRLGLAFSGSIEFHKARTPHAEYEAKTDDFNHAITLKLDNS